MSARRPAMQAGANLFQGQRQSLRKIPYGCVWTARGTLGGFTGDGWQNAHLTLRTFPQNHGDEGPLACDICS